MNSVNLSNSLFHSFDGQESKFLQTLGMLRNQRLSAKNMQSLRKFSKEVLKNLELFNEGKNDIVNQYGTDTKNEEGEVTGKELKFDNKEGMKAYNDLLQLSNKVDVEIINLDAEPDIKLSDIEYDTLVFLFEEIEAPVSETSNEEVK